MSFSHIPGTKEQAGWEEVNDEPLTPMSKINQQSPGPIDVTHITNPLATHGVELDLVSENGNGCRVATIATDNTDRLEVAVTDANLFAAAYTAFDKAGRALGIDATELANKIDLATLFAYAMGHVSIAAIHPETYTEKVKKMLIEGLGDTIPEYTKKVMMEKHLR